MTTAFIITVIVLNVARLLLFATIKPGTQRTPITSGQITFVMLVSAIFAAWGLALLL